MGGTDAHTYNSVYWRLVVIGNVPALWGMLLKEEEWVDNVIGIRQSWWAEIGRSWERLGEVRSDWDWLGVIGTDWEHPGSQEFQKFQNGPSFVFPFFFICGRNTNFLFGTPNKHFSFGIPNNLSFIGHPNWGFLRQGEKQRDIARRRRAKAQMMRRCIGKSPRFWKKKARLRRAVWKK